MDYYGLLFLYYLKGLSGKSVLRLFFNIEAGGTEQLLPENTSTPTTTPILADIQYPDGLRTDQYFTYRETPTTVSNKARIKTIKGNTLVWKQQVETLHATGSASGLTFTNNGDGSLTIDGTSTNTSAQHPSLVTNSIVWDTTHKYLVNMNNSSMAELNIRISASVHLVFEGDTFILRNGIGIGIPDANATTGLVLRLPANAGTEFDNYKIYPQVFDLTAMFGSTKANEIYAMETAQAGSGVAYFRSLFPLSYYSCNQGSLLSFNGNGIKTVGKNLFVPYVSGTTRTQNGITGVANADGTLTFTGTSTGIFWGIGDSPVFTLLKGTYTMSQTGGTNIRTVLVDRSKNLPIVNIYGGSPGTFTLNENTEVHLYNYIASGITVNDTIKVMLQFGRTVTEYEPYTSSTLSLPISTYFPNGMDGVGTDYDELTNTKATTRMTRVDLGSLAWAYSGASGHQRMLANLPLAKKCIANVKSNILCPIYTTDTNVHVYERTSDKIIALNDATPTQVAIYDSAYTDATTFKSAMNGVYLVYPLETPIETPITTEDANEALSLLMGKSVSSNNANQLIDIITKGE